jgi:hypothetical protein
MKLPSALLLASLLTSGVSFADGVDLSKLPPASTQTGVTFEKDILPLFKESSCVRCHGGEKPKAGLRLDNRESVLKGSKDGKVVTIGDSAKSELVIAVSRLDPEIAMPPERKNRGNRGSGNAAPHGRPGENHPDLKAGTNQPAAGGRSRAPMGPPPKPLTAEQVGLVRAWIDQGAK